MLTQILDKLENQIKTDDFQFRDINDSYFFNTAVRRAAAVQDLSLIKRVHSLLIKKNNIRFLNDQLNYKRYLLVFIHFNFFYNFNLNSVIKVKAI